MVLSSSYNITPRIILSLVPNVPVGNVYLYLNLLLAHHTRATFIKP